MKHIAGKVPALLSALVLAVGLCGCGASKIKDIRVTSFGIESYSLHGLRSLEAVLALGIDNPSMEFSVTDLSGIVRYNGEDFATYTADSVRVAARCASVYDLRCTATLSDGVTLKQLLSLAGQRSLDGVTTDLEARVMLKNGVGKKIRLKNLDIGKMVGKQEKQQ
ncbi:MAG: hypothetical protein ACI4TJ_08380 [Candidatus Cryptobacteroides sp.]